MFSTHQVMPAPDLFRASFVGQLIYYASGRKVLRYREEKPDFVVPERYLTPPSRRFSSTEQSDSVTIDDRERRTSTFKTSKNEAVVHEVAAPPAVHSPQAQESTVGREYLHHGDVEKAAFAGTAEGVPDKPEAEPAYDPYLVEWYGPDDIDNPYNVCCIARTSRMQN